MVIDADALRGHEDQPRMRDQQLAELRTCFSEEAWRAKPLHAWLWGPAGTGKSICVQFALRREVLPMGVTPVIVDCAARFTFFGCVESILDVLKPLRTTQRTRERQVSILRQTLNDQRAVIALDDIDVLRERDAAELLHLLCSFTTTSVICIAASRKVLLNLPDHVRSRFAPRQICFPRYKPEEVASIIESVAQRALRPGSWTDGCVQVIAEHSFGDARRAGALFRHAVHRAQEAGSDTMGVQHIQLGNFDHLNPRVEDLIQRLSSHHRLLYDIVSAKGSISGPDLERQYRVACQFQGFPPVSSRAVNKYLGMLINRHVLDRDHGPETTAWIYRPFREQLGPRTP